MIDNFDNLNNIVDCYRWPTLYFLPFVSLCWWWCQLFVCAWSYVSSESCWSRITGESRQSINLSGPQAHYSHGVHYFQWNPKRVDNCFLLLLYALICNHIVFTCQLIQNILFQMPFHSNCWVSGNSSELKTFPRKCLTRRLNPLSAAWPKD